MPNLNNYSNLQDIIHFNIDNWNDTDIFCSHGCHYYKADKTKVSTTNKIIILQLKLFIVSNNGSITKITNLKLNNLDNETVIINKKHYKIVSAIFHHGNSIQSGHYTCILRDNGYWLKVNDSQITRTHWPLNSEDVYLIFLEEIDSETPRVPLIKNDPTKIAKNFYSNTKNEPQISVASLNNTARNSKDIDNQQRQVFIKKQPNYKYTNANGNQSNRIIHKKYKICRFSKIIMNFLKI